jgi:hypothetical protein
MKGAGILVLFIAGSCAHNDDRKVVDRATLAEHPNVSEAKKDQEDERHVQIRITLSVYSGRPNPQWSLTAGPEYEKLAELIRGLKTAYEAPFDYDKWNRLGYASFWIVPKNIEGLPYAAHVWRDMAYLRVAREGPARYALGATEIYDLLVAQAEERGHKEFFVNYHKRREKHDSTE